MIVDKIQGLLANSELQLIMKLNKEQKIDIEDIALISQLLHKYLNLRADVFHDY